MPALWGGETRRDPAFPVSPTDRFPPVPGDNIHPSRTTFGARHRVMLHLTARCVIPVSEWRVPSYLTGRHW